MQFPTDDKSSKAKEYIPYEVGVKRIRRYERKLLAKLKEEVRTKGVKKL